VQAALGLVAVPGRMEPSVAIDFPCCGRRRRELIKGLDPQDGPAP
jgi:hypothetical protein